MEIVLKFKLVFKLTVMSQNNEHFLFGDFPENDHYFGTTSSGIFQKMFIILG